MLLIWAQSCWLLVVQSNLSLAATLGWGQGWPRDSIICWPLAAGGRWPLWASQIYRKYYWLSFKMAPGRSGQVAAHAGLTVYSLINDTQWNLLHFSKALRHLIFVQLYTKLIRSPEDLYSSLIDIICYSSLKIYSGMPPLWSKWSSATEYISIVLPSIHINIVDETHWTCASILAFWNFSAHVGFQPM